MSPKKILVVIGATGNQGSSVAKTFLNLPNWHVRCVTRSPSTTASQALAKNGAEVIQADLSSAPSLSHAFENASAIFVNTDFWGVFTSTKKSLSGQENFEAKASQIAYDTEVSWAKNAAHAAAAVPSLERYVYSTLPNIKSGSNRKYSSHHNESKGIVTECIVNEMPELAKKTSFIYLGAYATNPFFATPRFDAGSQSFKFVLPLKKDVMMPIIDQKSSTGPLVRALIEDEEPGKHLLAYDSFLRMGEIVEMWGKASGAKMEYVEVTTQVMHEQFGVPKDVLQAPDAISEFGYMGGVENFIEPGQLKNKVGNKSYEEWLRGRDWNAVLEEIRAGSMPLLKSME